MNKENSIMVAPTGEVLLSASEIELVKKTVAQGSTDDELRLFLHDCRRQGVHPLDKLIHFTKRRGSRGHQGPTSGGIMRWMYIGIVFVAVWILAVSLCNLAWYLFRMGVRRNE